MNLSSLDINIGDPGDFQGYVDDAISKAVAGDAVWLTAGGEAIAAIVPPDVLRFYARHNRLIPEHEMHHLDGPRECDRCALLRANSGWLFSAVDISRTIAQTADGTSSSPATPTSSVASSQNRPSIP